MDAEEVLAVLYAVLLKRLHEVSNVPVLLGHLRTEAPNRCYESYDPRPGEVPNELGVHSAPTICEGGLRLRKRPRQR